MRVLVIEPERRPGVREIDGPLEVMQNIDGVRSRGEGMTSDSFFEGKTVAVTGKRKVNRA